MEGNLEWGGAQEHKNTVEEVESTAVVSTIVQVAVKPISIRNSDLSKAVAVAGVFLATMV